jgi:meso-butanediol dehydrogenase / (S,S)-butanediol dehydrogenase / diacetyl reductase
MKNLKDKVVLVTGGGAGLGKAIAQRFASEGAKVVIAERNAEAGQAAAAEIKARFVHTDVSDPASVQASVDFAVASFGAVDIIVNNAGIESLRGPIHECTLENWRRVLDVNLNGVFYGMKFGIAQLIKQGKGGNVVNISSVAGLVGMPDLPPYCAAKAAVSNLTREGALEYGALGIRVNAVAPTAVMTAMNQRMMEDVADPAAFVDFLNTMNPLPGMPSPEDIAAAVAFLASDDARFISGVTLPVDGGFVAR